MWEFALSGPNVNEGETSDYVVLYDRSVKSAILEWVGWHFAEHTWTYRLGSWFVIKGDKMLVELLRIPLPLEEMRKISPDWATWRDCEDE